MFERFTDRARRVVVLAQEEARTLDHNYIGTEHILLGLVRDDEGVASKALESLGISLEMVRAEVEEIIGRGQTAPAGHIPFTPRAKKVLELSLRESRQLGHSYIGTEHILLGLVREGKGVAAQVLEKLGAHLERVRERVILLLGAHPPETGAAQPGVPMSLDELTGRLTRIEDIERRAKEIAAEAGDSVVEPEHQWVAALRMNLEQMEQTVEAYREKLRWAEDRLEERRKKDRPSEA